jgi:hypothetical protein
MRFLVRGGCRSYGGCTSGHRPDPPCRIFCADLVAVGAQKLWVGVGALSEEREPPPEPGRWGEGYGEKKSHRLEWEDGVGSADVDGSLRNGEWLRILSFFAMKLKTAVGDG